MISAGPMKPRIARRMLSTATSALIAADAPFGIRKLMPVANRAKRNVVGQHQADRRLDLVDARPEHRPIHGRRRDRAVHHVIDLVVLQREDFGQPAANFVERGHGHERLPAVESGHLRGRDGDGIKIVVPEFAGRRIALRVVAEVRAVGSPTRARPTSRPARPSPAQR